jgi:hypothetical protein
MDFRKKLQTGVYEVRFTKKDGTEREMLCTLLPDKLPPTKGGTRKLPDHLITVFDLEKNDWRSINTNTLTYFCKVE